MSRSPLQAAENVQMKDFLCWNFFTPISSQNFNFYLKFFFQPQVFNIYLKSFVRT